MSERIHLDKLVVAADQKSSEENYWLNQFSGEFRNNSFPYDVKESGPAMRQIDSVQFQLTGSMFSRLMDLINQSDVRLYIVFVSALLVLLHKYTGDKDITVGAPIYKQEIEVEFINTILPLRNQVEDHLTFKELLLRVGQVLLQAVENQNYPIETLLHHLNIPHSREDEFPLFDVTILLENIHDEKYIQHIKKNIKFSFLRTGDSIRGLVEYHSLRYEKSTLERIVSHFMNLLEQILHYLDIKITDIDILTETEKQYLLFDFNDTKTRHCPGKTIHQLFEEQVERGPDSIAVVGMVHSFPGGSSPNEHMERKSPLLPDPNCSLTYLELNQRSNQVARFLISKGVTPGSIVGITVERSIEMMVGILGILKAGGAYLPISPDLPMTRKKFMLEDSNTKHLLLQKHLVDHNKELIKSLSPENILFLEDLGIELNENPQVEVRPDNPGYLIYTSGSTGQPKGVILQHKGIINYVKWAANTYVRNETVVFPLYTSFSFDLTVTSIFTPLVTGNMIVIYSGDDREFLIKKVIEEDRVHVVKLTPSHLKLIREIVKGDNLNIKRFIVGGENLTTQLARDINSHFSNDIEIYNEYGPTETVVGSMIHRFDPEQDNGHSVPIGVPIDNTQIYLLDENKKPVPFGAVGELFISGDGVAMGYLNRPELTAEYFMENFFLPGERMYATGDLARWYSNGKIEFLGRKDQQVKIRGFRVELGEIENQIKKFNRNSRSSILDETIVDTHKLREVKRCGKCLLPTNYPGIHFDDQGVCHACREFEGYREHLNRYFKEPNDFMSLVERVKAENPGNVQYDCLLLFSGGKDSSYVLYQLMDMGLKVLTFTFDNGYISEAAFNNIRRITSALKVDNIVVKNDNMKAVFVESLTANHNVCQGCWHALNSVAAEIAYKKGINLVISGLSRGQIFDMRLEGLFRSRIFEEDEIEEKLLAFRKTFHAKENKFSRILNVALDEKAVEAIQFVDFFRYSDTPVHQIREYLTAKGWTPPGDTGFCSSNCTINDVGIYVHLKEEGYHFYAPQLSWDIRLGHLSRENGLIEMGFESDLNHVDKILEEIGYYDSVSIKDAVVVDIEDEERNIYLWAYVVSATEFSLPIPALREYLAGELPGYMIPSQFLQVDKIPLTASGKVDKKALLELGSTKLDMGTAYVEPKNEKEKLIADLCKEVFKMDKIGINDNFFTLGATSFNIIQLTSKLQGVFKKDIPVLTMFEYPTIASFLDYMELEMPAADAAAYQEQEDWVASKKRGQDKFRKLREKRIKGDING